jgi:ParB family chromosome partitioning protein
MVPMPSLAVYPEGEKVPAAVGELARRIERDGGTALAAFREPVGRGWHLFAMLPLELVAATPFQRKPSATHLKRLTEVMTRLERFVDPIVVVVASEPDPGAEESDVGGAAPRYWTPNGNHRRLALELAAARAKVIPAIVIPQTEVQYQILALNTEKAHNLREKCHEVIGMYRDLAARDDSRRENEFAFEFQEAHFITLGLVYEERGRFAGSAYAPILRRVDKFLRSSLRNALPERERRRDALIAADEVLSEIVESLKGRGVKHPFVKPFVLSRCNPLPRARKNLPDFDETLAKLTRALRRFDAGRVRLEHVAGAAAYAPPDMGAE